MPNDQRGLPGDAAFLRKTHRGTQIEATYAGAQSFMRRRYTRDLAGVDVAITGIPFDQSVTNRPGTRFGPEAIRRASNQHAWGPYWPWFFDPFDSRNAELKDAFMIWSVTAIFAAPVFIGIYFAIGGMVVPRQMQTVAYLNRDGDEIRFFNVEYQRMFEGYYPPAAAPDSYAPADEEPVRW